MKEEKEQILDNETFDFTREKFDIDYLKSLDLENIKKVILPKDLEPLPANFLSTWKNLEEVVITEDCKKIPTNFFSNCSKLKTVILPDSIRSIEKEAFSKCKNLSKINIPKQVKKIPDNCFKGCSSLVFLDTKNIIEVGESAFEDCKRLQSFSRNATTFRKKAYKNCHSLKEVVLNDKVTYLAEALFSGCHELRTVIGKEVSLGNATFKNCYELKAVPSCVKKLAPYSFANCYSLTSFNNIFRIIPLAAFKNCKNLHTIDNSNYSIQIDSEAFLGCENLEEFIFHDSIKNIKAMTFKNCYKLKKVYLPTSLDEIGNSAFENCFNLESPNFTHNLSLIKKRAYYNCHSIEEIHFPARFKIFEDQALANLYSLKKITSSPHNNYGTFQDELLIHKITQNILLYAGGLQYKEYSLEKLCNQIIDGQETTVPINGIEAYAFSGATHLETLAIGISIRNFDYLAFKDCKKLKKLIVFNMDFFSDFYPNITDKGRPYFEKNIMEDLFPFEKLEIEDNIRTIRSYKGELLFQNLATITFPKNTHFQIIDTPFNSCKNLKKVIIPLGITLLPEHSFFENTMIHFQDRFEIPQRLFKSLEIKNNEKIYEFNDGSYFLEKDEHFRTVSKTEIKEQYKDFDIILEEPQKVLNFQKLLSNYELTEDNKKLLNNGYLVKYLSDNQVQRLLESFDNITEKVLQKSQLLKEPTNFPSTKIWENSDTLLSYISLLREYGIKDNSQLNTHFIPVVDEINMIPILKNYNANIKRMIKKSNVLSVNDNELNSLIDLCKLGTAIGVFESDQKTSQRACTFLIDNMFSELKNNEPNKNKIIGSDIHRLFETMERATYDPGFTVFLMKYFDTLMDMEREGPRIIADIYNQFPKIQETSTSHKGEQRFLQVTPEKCSHYFDSQLFAGITEENLPIAKLLKNWFSDQTSFDIAVKTLDETKNAPRNIFTKNQLTEEKWIFDNRKENDLIEKNETDYSYEWLPKNDIHNLVLGKYCSCCAHVAGAGAGIMRASMIDPNCQNMVIRDEQKKIIAKSTIYINRTKQYAVFNNVESTLNSRSKEMLEKIYQAFIRGMTSFYDTYNKNNPTLPLTKVSIGEGMNTIIENLNTADYETLTHDLLSPINYATYAIEKRGTYIGNASQKQKLLIPKKRG